ncbi:hypothetical protein P5673_017582 [Acropora cervicornis]|uniref:COX assembly mitochondrial protein n=1 Tax=Acropora cervicornis TaxID=6130 RepID=A0AAD9V3Q1_ACRCE|nr:hypothetical protein P5673_017582 [Acropora cervicornis]
MAATNVSEGDSSSDISSKISPWARGENLRYVEKEVLIPKIVREKAMANCSDLVKGTYQDKDFFDKCRQEYLQKREDFQKDYVQSGKVKDLKKKDSVIL